MRLDQTTKKAHGLNEFIFHHRVRGDVKTITVQASNESMARTKAWRQVSAIYKETK